MGIKLANDFVIPADMDQTWALLNNLERVAPCLPGASITGRDGEAYLGTVKIKVGPIGMNLQGVARFITSDESNRTATISMSGKDTKGNTATDATMVVTLEQIDSSHTQAHLDTDVEISGRMAQFGRGAVADVSNRLIKQFTDNLSALVQEPSSPAGVVGQDAAHPSPQQATQTPAPVTQAATEGGGLDAMAIIAPTVLRQLGPPLLGLIVGILLGRLGRGRSAGRRNSGCDSDPWADPRLNAWLDRRLDSWGCG